MSRLATFLFAACAALATVPAAAAPFADGFRYTITCSGPCEFDEAIVAGSFQDLTIWVAGSQVATVDSFESYLFAPGVTEFEIRDIAPPVDVADPTAFPVFLDWTGPVTKLTITALLVQSTPTPGSLALVVAAGLALALARRRTSARRWIHAYAGMTPQDAGSPPARG